MRLAFYVPRLSHLKLICPVAAAARRRGDDCLALYPSGTLRGPKDDARAGVGVDPALTPFNLARAIADEVDAKIHLRDVDWAVAVGLRTAPEIRAATRLKGIRWAAADHLGDNLLFALEDGPAALVGWDVATTLAQEPLTMATQGTSTPMAEALGRLVPVGYPELDQLALPGMTREACRAKWNLPAEGRIALVAPAARPANLSRVRRWWWGRTAYPFIMRQVRRWCDRHGALMLVKTRAKHRDPTWLKRLADLTVGDGCYYPFNTLELLMAADVVIGFASALAVEASALGRHQFWLHGWPPQEGEWPSTWRLRLRFFLGPGGLWNHAGAEQFRCYDADWREALGQWAEEGLWPSVGEFEWDQMRQATEQWAGPVDHKASERFLDLLEARHGR